MSLINQMLRDLEQRRGRQDAPGPGAGGASAAPAPAIAGRAVGDGRAAVLSSAGASASGQGIGGAAPPLAGAMGGLLARLKGAAAGAAQSGAGKPAAPAANQTDLEALKAKFKRVSASTWIIYLATVGLVVYAGPTVLDVWLPSKKKPSYSVQVIQIPDAMMSPSPGVSAANGAPALPEGPMAPVLPPAEGPALEPSQEMAAAFPPGPGGDGFPEPDFPAEELSPTGSSQVTPLPRSARPVPAVPAVPAATPLTTAPSPAPAAPGPVALLHPAPAAHPEAAVVPVTPARPRSVPPAVPATSRPAPGRGAVPPPVGAHQDPFASPAPYGAGGVLPPPTPLPRPMPRGGMAPPVMAVAEPSGGLPAPTPLPKPTVGEALGVPMARVVERDAAPRPAGREPYAAGEVPPIPSGDAVAPRGNAFPQPPVVVPPQPPVGGSGGEEPQGGAGAAAPGEPVMRVTPAGQGGSGTVAGIQRRAEENYQKALALWQRGELRAAEVGLWQTISWQMNHVAARRLLARILHENDRTGEAVDLLAEGMTLVQDAGLVKDYARLLVANGEGRKAMEVLERAREGVGRGNGDLLSFLAELYRKNGRHWDAINQYDVLLRQQPDNALWWLGVGVSLEQVGELPQARDAFTRARDLNQLSRQLQAFVQERLRVLAR